MSNLEITKIPIEDDKEMSFDHDSDSASNVGISFDMKDIDDRRRKKSI